MRYYNLHTHKKEKEKNTISIYNLSQDEISSDMEGSNDTYFSAGIHPWSAEQQKTHISSIGELANSSKIVAIGECGLDKLTDTSIELQIKIFKQQVELANKYNLPLIIHCVKAWDELLRLHKENNPSSPWILHGFRGGKEQAEQLKKVGFYFSLGEYYNASCLSVIYPTRLFIETDESDIGIDVIYENIATDLACKVSDLQTEIEQNVSLVFDLS